MAYSKSRGILSEAMEGEHHELLSRRDSQHIDLLTALKYRRLLKLGKRRLFCYDYLFRYAHVLPLRQRTSMILYQFIYQKSIHLSNFRIKLIDEGKERIGGKRSAHFTKIGLFDLCRVNKFERIQNSPFNFGLSRDRIVEGYFFSGYPNFSALP